MLRTQDRNEDRFRSGSATIETAIILPILALLLLGTIQLGFLIFTQNNMVQASREAARNLAVQAGTAAQARQVALSQLAFSGLSFEISVCDAANPDPVNCPAAEDVSVGISVPLWEASLIDFLGMFGSGTDCSDPSTQCLEARITMRKES